MTWSTSQCLELWVALKSNPQANIPSLCIWVGVELPISPRVTFWQRVIARKKKYPFFGALFSPANSLRLQKKKKSWRFCYFFTLEISSLSVEVFFFLKSFSQGLWNFPSCGSKLFIFFFVCVCVCCFVFVREKKKELKEIMCERCFLVKRILMLFFFLYCDYCSKIGVYACVFMGTW